MKTTTNPGRDILSLADIAATCGDGDCATSDAEMTAADHAAVALVAAEVAAADALTVGDMIVIRYGNGTQVARIREIKARGVMVDRFYFAKSLSCCKWQRGSGMVPSANVIGRIGANDPRFEKATAKKDEAAEGPMGS